VSGEKTEKATPKKLKDLRRKGVSARSFELPSGVALVALVVVLPSMLGRFLSAMTTDMSLTLSAVGSADLGTARELAQHALSDASRALAPGIAVVGATALLAGSVVTRSRPNPAMLRPRASRLNPGKALKRMLSLQSLTHLLKDVAKLAALGAVTWTACKEGAARLANGDTGLPALRSVVGDTATSLLWRVALLALLVGLVDAVWQRRSFGKQARMSKQDVSEEHKQAEGNPHTKGAIRSRMLAVARSRMIQAVPKADVVLANPTHLVVALAYAPGQAAPVVVAKGAGATAQRIKDIAAEHGVPVLEDKPLARAIYKAADVGDGIPVELFRAVAEVLAVVYAARRRGVRPRWSSRMVTA
jgi:flagellar biosynthetic protein FlhB